MAVGLLQNFSVSEFRIEQPDMVAGEDDRNGFAAAMRQVDMIPMCSSSDETLASDNFPILDSAVERGGGDKSSLEDMDQPELQNY